MEFLPHAMGYGSASIHTETDGNSTTYQVQFKAPGRLRRLTNQSLAKLHSAAVMADYSSLLDDHRELSQQRARSVLQSSTPADEALYNFTTELIDLLPSTLVIANTDHRILYTNSVSTRMFGYDATEMQRLELTQIIPPSFTDQHFYLDKPPAGTLSVSGLTQNHTLLPLLATQFHFSSGDQLLKAYFLQDVTEQQQMRASESKLRTELLVAQKAQSVGQLTSNIVHDFNNLLVTILGYSDLASETASPEDLHNYLQEIRHSAEQGTELTQQLLGFTLKDTSKVQLLGASEVLGNTHNMIKRLLPANIHFELFDQSEHCYVNVDPIQIQQIITNLILNAKDAMPVGGLLSVTMSNCLRDSRSYLCIDVTDTDIGMDDLTQQQIFDPLFTSKPSGHGTGLGLGITQDIVQRHNGLLEVESELGAGTTFHLLLPCADDRIAAKSAVKKQISDRGTETVLLIESNNQVRTLARLILVGAGYSVIEAADGINGIDSYLNHKHDIELVLIDVVLPGRGGREVAQIIKQHDEDMKIAFLSGYPDDSPYLEFVRDQHLALIKKPFDLEQLRHSVYKILHEEPPQQDEQILNSAG